MPKIKKLGPAEMKNQKIIQDQLRFLSAVAEQMTEGIAVTGLDGTIIYLNDAWCRMHGYPSPEGLLGRNLNIFHTLEQSEQDIKPFIAKVKKFGIHRGEVGHITNDGKRFRTSMVAILLKDEHGKPVALAAIARDVNEQEQAKAAHRENRLFLQNVLDAIQDGISVLDRNLNVVITNRWMEKKYADYLPLVGRPCYQVFQNRESVCPWCPSVHTFETGEAHTDIVPYPTAEKPTGWIEISIFPVRNEQGQVTNIIEYMRDISNQRRAEKSLRESEKHLQLALMGANLGLWDWNIQTGEIIFNEHWAEMLGYRLEEIEPHIESWEKLVHPDDLPAVKEVLNAHLDGKTPFYETEYRLRAKDGSWIWILDRGRVLKRNGEGKPLRAAGTHLNINQRLQLEKEKTQFEAQYYRVQKLESIGRLAGGIAHDLNNLLSPILGYGEMLLEESVGIDPRKFQLEQIVTAAKRARDLVRQLLAFSRKQTLEFKRIDLNILLANFEKLLRRMVREDIVIRLIPAEYLPPIRGDVGQMEQVVMNLVVNSQDAMPDGGVLTIETAQVDLDESSAAQHENLGPGSYVRLEVSDTGIGIDQQTRGHLFEPFYSTKGERGTGLGLATVYGIVRQHGGNIEVDSEQGNGTTFRVYLPVSTEPPADEVPMERSIGELRGTETILLVEDDEQVRELTLDILGQMGYTVITAAGGHEALAKLDSHSGPLHLLLTDIVMPGMNGKELFERVSSRIPDLKVLYISGYTDEVIVHHGIMERGIQYLEKPFSAKALAAKLREVLDR